MSAGQVPGRQLQPTSGSAPTWLTNFIDRVRAGGAVPLTYYLDEILEHQDAASSLTDSSVALEQLLGLLDRRVDTLTRRLHDMRHRMVSHGGELDAKGSLDATSAPQLISRRRLLLPNAAGYPLSNQLQLEKLQALRLPTEADLAMSMEPVRRSRRLSCTIDPERMGVELAMLASDREASSQRSNTNFGNENFIEFEDVDALKSFLENVRPSLTSNEQVFDSRSSFSPEMHQVTIAQTSPQDTVLDGDDFFLAEEVDNLKGSSQREAAGAAQNRLSLRVRDFQPRLSARMREHLEEVPHGSGELLANSKRTYKCRVFKPQIENSSFELLTDKIANLSKEKFINRSQMANAKPFAHLIRMSTSVRCSPLPDRYGGLLHRFFADLHYQRRASTRHDIDEVCRHLWRPRQEKPVSSSEKGADEETLVIGKSSKRRRRIQPQELCDDAEIYFPDEDDVQPSEGNRVGSLDAETPKLALMKRRVEISSRNLSPDSMFSLILSAHPTHGSIKFSELVKGGSRQHVTKALMHVLILSTKGLATVRQSKPFTDFSIKPN